MGYLVRMPQLGMSMEEGTVVEWRSEQGATVGKGDTLVIVESEKATHEVEAREGGVLRAVLVDAGDRVEPGTPIGIVAGPDADLSEYERQLDDGTAAVAGGEGRTDDSGRASAVGSAGADGAGESPADVRATPGARKLAGEAGVDLARIDGTGPQGVITEDDVRAGLDAQLDERSDGDESGDSDRDDVVTEPAVTVTEARELSGVQRTISDRLSESDREAVHVTLNRSIDSRALRAVKDAVDGAASAASVSFTDLLIKGVAEALSAHPEFNAHFEDGTHRLIKEVNVGVAVDTGRGLVTPVIAGADARSVEAITRVRKSLTDRAVSGDLTADEHSGGTFTVTNLGPLGVDNFDPIIDPPQIAILGVGRVRDDGSLTLSLSFDHRVVNGADAARFLETLVGILTDEARLVAFFDADIDTGVDAEREVRVANSSGLAGEYRTSHGDVPFDEPTDVGGDGTAPSPVEHVLGALGACLSLMVRQQAGRDNLDVGTVEAVVAGSPPRGPLESISIDLTIETDADQAAVERVITKAERACYVARVLSNDLEIAVDWTRI